MDVSEISCECKRRPGQVNGSSHRSREGQTEEDVGPRGSGLWKSGLWDGEALSAFRVVDLVLRRVRRRRLQVLQAELSLPGHILATSQLSAATSGIHVACPPSPPLPLSIVLLGPCRPSIPPDLCGQHWNHLLLDQETQRTRHPGIAGCMGLRMVTTVSRHAYVPVDNTSLLRSHLLVTLPSRSKALESFVVEVAHKSTHIAILVRPLCGSLSLPA